MESLKVTNPSLLLQLSKPTGRAGTAQSNASAWAGEIGLRALQADGHVRKLGS